MEKQDEDLRQVIAEESSRGRRQPVNAVSLAHKQRMKRLASLLEVGRDKNAYIAIIRDDFGLPEGSREFLQLLDVWHERHGH
jgi:predicted HAD superfamily phosphohydrolase